MRVLLHACCGPCMIVPHEELVAQHDVDVAYANPNIHPVEEYERRRDTLIAYAHEHGINVRELDYDPVAWMHVVAGVEDDPARRCTACFSLRLSLVAEYAVANDYDAIATTLAVSPYQDAEALRQAGTEAAAAVGLMFLDHDFRDRYSETSRRAADLGMYRQNYCGCLLSDIEARAARAARRAKRAADRLGTSESDQLL